MQLKDEEWESHGGGAGAWVVGVGAEKPPAWAVDHNQWGAMGPGAMRGMGGGAGCARGKG